MAIECKMGTHAIQLHDPWVWCACVMAAAVSWSLTGRQADRGSAYISSTAHSHHLPPHTLRAHQVNYWKQPAKLSVVHSHSLKDIDLKMLSSFEWLCDRKCTWLMMWWRGSTRWYIHLRQQEQGYSSTQTVNFLMLKRHAKVFTGEPLIEQVNIIVFKQILPTTEVRIYVVVRLNIKLRNTWNNITGFKCAIIIYSQIFAAKISCSWVGKSFCSIGFTHYFFKVISSHPQIWK